MNEANWVIQRDSNLGILTVRAAELLVGRTVESVIAEPHDPACDGENRLTLIFTDGTAVHITGGYGGFTGGSCDEYIELIRLDPVTP
jgi:hypothetical protein